MPRAVFRLLILAFLALGPVLGRCGTFTMTATVDRDHLELGDSLHLSIAVTMHGQMAFGPQLEQPSFSGFAPQGGPSQSQSITYINGAMTMQQTLTWELEAQKSGVLTLGPFRAEAKDALNGSIVRVTPAIRVTVTRPKNLAFHLPVQPTPVDAPPEGAAPPDDSALRDIKGDRPLPWLLIGLVGAGVLGALGLLLWWWWKPKAPKVEAVPRDPAQLALEQLEKARQAMLPGGELAFVREASGLLRQYLRHKLGLRPGATLAEALRAVRFQAPGAAREDRDDLRLRLDWLQYSGAEVQPADADEVHRRVRAQVIELERIIIPPAPEPAAPPAPKGPPRTRKR